MRKAKLATWLGASVVAVWAGLPSVQARSAGSDSKNLSTTGSEVGRYGGRLVISQRAEPKTLNPAVDLDISSREIIGLLHADLIHINRSTQETEPGLASSWRVSPDGRQYTLHLRRGVLFSDGQPFDADDVVFTFRVYLDERIHSPQRDLLIISGVPIRVQKVDAYTVRFDLPERYAAADRLFDGLAILPRHDLLTAYEEGKLTRYWSLSSPAEQMAGLGPFRFKEYVPGQHITLERNQHYWKKDHNGNPLPYLNEVVSVFTGNADAEAMRFELGEIDVVSRLSATNFSALAKHEKTGKFHLYDAGPSLESNFLFFNLNELKSRSLPSISHEQDWFGQIAFRKAVSSAIDRAAIARLVYRGRAVALSTYVTPGNARWLNKSIPQQSCSVPQARQLLEEAGFSWRTDGRLLDGHGTPVTFSILFNAGNPQHSQIATLLQADLERIGIDVKVVPLEYHALLNRVFKTYEYEAVIMALVSGDADPNSEMNVWSSTGSAHVWDLDSKRAQTPWQQEIDALMRQQMVTAGYEQRKRLYDRVQELVWEHLPLICLVSPDVLVGAAERIGNFHPANLSSYSLWNVEQLYWRP